MFTAASEPAAGPARCSARGCRQAAVVGLLWNNPALHDTSRRKVWTACDQHRESLGQFLAMRGFLRATVPLDEVARAVEAARAQGDSRS